MNHKKDSQFRTRTFVRPRIETLEDRELLATCHVTRLSDSGAGFGFRGDLRYCINKVNTAPGPDNIDFNVSGTIHLTGALPDLSTDVDIIGPGSTLLTVRRNSGGYYRIFTVTNGVVARISGLTATNGNLTGGQGGGIHNQGTLALVDTKVNSNTAGTHGGTVGSGGGIYNTGSLQIVNSGISNNRTNGCCGAPGAGILNTSTGSLTIINSSIVQNYANGIQGDDVNTYGGGIYNAGSATIQYSTIASNTALAQAYWFSVAYGGGIYTSGPLTISNSTIYGNYAIAYDEYGGLVQGGGIYKEGNTLIIENSTIANNTSSGVYMSGGSATITHSTIAGNYQGIFINVGGQGLTLRNSIVANNSNRDVYGTITTSGYNLIGNSNGGGGFDATDILDVDPMLGTLASNGGPTLTMALLPGSPAIDSGANQMAPEWDQRGPGFPRIVNGTIDRGAFEVQSTSVPTAPDDIARRGSPDPAVLITAKIDDDD